MRRAKALSRFIEFCERPIRPVPEMETKCERRVRLLEDVLERASLYEKAGLVEKGENNRMQWWLQQNIEHKLIVAKRELRFERRDY